ncbi:cell division protein ZapE [Aliiglaciecola lipolytica]|uniref:AFG1 family ATPase n=1 Tax=Aliiglaciecola lipolytica E3 TaxID=1127673 RepID=K6YB00_9ALTE|nr:cell division protein ZapE [Aliiglaciecola lipolytica]GAC13803.1 AFG1 family ATPase [Aliiglaciecola lipolytica E3]
MFDSASYSSKFISPQQVYQSQLGKKLVDDPSQLEAVSALEELFWQITQQKDSTEQIKGLYLWGDVGRGKTFLMDLFYDTLPTKITFNKGKLRLHFHRFMSRIHNALKEHSGQQDPLPIIAKALANQFSIICIDEFFVSDIGDAMLLAGLFTCLFDNGVVLVATSNTPVERLYENGLARHKFLPFIGLLQQHTQSINLSGERDHRIQHQLSESDIQTVFNASPNIGLAAKMDFSKLFSELTPKSNIVNKNSINICHRDIQVERMTDMKLANSVAWFNFYALCAGPRSQLDYIEIASSFNTVMVSDVPQLSGKVRGWIKARGTEDGMGDNQAIETGERVISYAVNDDMTRRFISLIDELYDQGVRLFLSTQVPLAELYLEGALTFEFRRTFSRLIEMSRG